MNIKMSTIQGNRKLLPPMTGSIAGFFIHFIDAEIEFGTSAHFFLRDVSYRLNNPIGFCSAATASTQSNPNLFKDLSNFLITLCS
jgi:hypothetical protein